MAHEMPEWFGHQYPSRENLEDLAWALGGVVRPCVVGCCYLPIPRDEFAVIGVPPGLGPLETIWILAHEVGHLLMHHGYISQWTTGRQENQAARWAAAALIPMARIQAHENASLDAFIGALSAHYEAIPLEACPLRELAAQIASHRLRALQEVA